MPKIPAYQRIKSTILTKIHTGQWAVGSAIPTEMALSREFDVARMTVNRALKELTDEQVLERRQGSGTFVAQQRFNQTFITVRNIAHDIQNTGKRYYAKVISQLALPKSDLPPSARAVFDDTQRLYQVEIVHFGDGKPVQFERRFVDLTIIPAFEYQDFNTVNTSDYLISQVPLVRGCYFIEAMPCPSDVANFLECQPNSPALCLSRYTYSGDKVVTFVQMWHDGATFRFDGTIG